MSVPVPTQSGAIVAGNGHMLPHFREFLSSLVPTVSAASGPSWSVGNIARHCGIVRLAFNLVPASVADLYLIARTAGGDVAAYSWAWPYNDGGATAAADEDTSDPQIIVAKDVQSAANTGGVSGVLEIHDIQSDRYKRVTGRVAHFDGSRERSTAPAARIDTADALTGFILQFSGGVLIASGRVEVVAT